MIMSFAIYRVYFNSRPLLFSFAHSQAITNHSQTMNLTLWRLITLQLTGQVANCLVSAFPLLQCAPSRANFRRRLEQATGALGNLLSLYAHPNVRAIPLNSGFPVFTVVSAQNVITYSD